MATDPVCGMTVKESEAEARMDHAGETYYFCSSACHDKFHTNPDAYINSSEAAASPEAREHIVIPVTGMRCPDCSQKIERALTALPGVAHAAANLSTGVAAVDYDPARTTVAQLLEAVRQAGFTPGAARLRLAIEGMT